MQRRAFLRLLPAAAALPLASCLPEIAPAAETVGLRCPRCFAPAHYHRLSQVPLWYDQAHDHFIEHWMTPRGQISVHRTPTMDFAALMQEVERREELTYGA